MEVDVLGLQRQFREIAIAWSLVRNDANLANPLFDRQHQIAKQLRSSSEGREAVEALLDDDDVEVRAIAATASLAWESQLGLDVLSSIAKRTDLIGFESEVTLKSFRAGTLNLNW
jgi:hypothetical protein